VEVSVAPAVLSFERTTCGPAPAARSFEVTVTPADAALGWTMDPPDAPFQSWPSGPKTFTVSASPDALVGDHTATVAIQACASGVCKTAKVSLAYHVSPCPFDVEVSVAPAALLFESTTCDPTPPAQSLEVTATPVDAEIGWTIDPPGAPFYGWRTGATTFTVYASVDGPAGDHTATGTIRACVFSECRTASVSLAYHVSPCPLVAEPAAVALEVIEGMAQPATATVTVTDSPGMGAWTGSVEANGCPSADVAVEPSSGDALPASITVYGAPSRSGLIYVEYDCGATLRVVHGARERTAPIHVHVVPQTVAFEPPSLAFSAYTGQHDLPAPQRVTVTSDRVPLAFTVDGRPWISTTPSGVTPAEIPVAPNSTDWVPGSYPNAVSFAWAGGSATVPVSYVVYPRSLVASPGDLLGLAIDRGTTLAQTSLAVALTSFAGPIAWTAAVDVPWLRVAPTAGTTGTVPGVTLSADLALVNAFPVGSSSATLTVSYVEPNGSPNAILLPVRLYMGLPRIAGGLPRAVVEGAPDRLTFGGGDFVSASQPLGFSLDGGAPTAPSWNTYDLAELSVPALSAGRHVVTVANRLGLDRGRVEFDSVPPATRAPAVLASAGRKTQVALDDATGFLYVSNAGAGVVERFAERDGWSRQALAIPGLRDAALAPGASILAAIAGAVVRLVDARTFSLADVQPAGTLPGPEPAANDWRLAFAADGRALVVSATDFREYAFVDGSTVVSAEFGWCGGRLFTAADGRDLAIACAGDATPNSPELFQPRRMFWGLLSPPFPASFDADVVALDREKRRVLLLDLGATPGASDTLLLDFTGSYPFTILPGKLPGTIVEALVKRDGSRAIALDGATGNVRVFDLATLPAGETDPLVELGPAGGFAPAGTPGAAPVLALSADERTLFVAGDDAIVIVPLP
jgi:hypothetical protein